MDYNYPITPAARARLARQQRGTLAEEWEDFGRGLPDPVRRFAARIGQRPAMPTQEEIDAQNSARQARRTLKEGQGGQTAAGIRRMQAGLAIPVTAAAGSVAAAPEIGWAEPGQPGSDVPFLVQPGLPPVERAAEIARQAAAVRSQVIPTAAPASAVPGGPPRTTSDWDMPERIARSQRGWAKQQAMAGTLRDLREEGFAPVSGLPGGIDPRSGNPWLGPNQIMVREGSVGPEAYQAAMDARGDAIQRGQDAGFERSHGYGGYLPNLPTQQALQEGGPITEYAVPGKGTATFMGKRQGGGTLSVIPGRTPEEQALIDQRVAGIDRQTAAMRGLRNAEREAMGLAPLPDQQQLAERELVDNVMSQYGNTPAIALEILKQAQAARATRATTEQAGLQAARESQQAQREAMEDRRRWEAEYGLEVAETKMDAVTKDRQWAMDTLKEIPVMSDKEALELDENFKYETPTGETVVDEKAFQETFNVRPLKADEPPTGGQLYFNEAEGRYELATQEGMRPLGNRLEVYRYRHAQLQRQQQRRLGQ